MRRYFDELRALPRPDGKFSLSCYAMPESQVLVSDAFLLKATEYWDEAERAAKADDPSVQTNVMLGRFSVDYTRYMRMKGRFDPLSAYNAGQTDPRPTEVERRDFPGIVVRLKRTLEAVPRIAVNETPSLCKKWNEELFCRAATALLPSEAFVPRTVGVATASLLEATDPRRLNGKHVDDPASADGKLLWLSGKVSGWNAELWLEPTAFDPGVPYRLRLRVKFTVRPNADLSAEVLKAGIYDLSGGQARTEWSKKGYGIKNGEWIWLDMGWWTPRPGDYLWIGMGSLQGKKENPAVEEVWIDQVEFSRR